MVRLLFAMLFMTAVTTADCHACNHEVDPVRTTIERFYTEYLDALVRNDDVEVERVKEKYLSRSLARRIRRMYDTMKLDYDPFLQAQDYDRHSLDGIKIEKVDTSDNRYRVYLWDSYNKRYRQVDLIMKPTREGYIVDGYSDR